MRVALAQLNPTVGDIGGNAALVIASAADAEARDADLVVFPELVLTGYPPEDLVLKEHFVRDARRALDHVAASVRVPCLIGFVDEDEHGHIYNAAALCRSGAVEGVYRKQHLPNYGVFDERRHFTPGSQAFGFEVDGVAIAVTICEDVWVPGPVAGAAESGARIVVNLSASPFHAGKGASRERMLAERARENGVWLTYANLVGGQDELVFDGRSVAISPSGAVVARAAGFAPELLVTDVGPGADPEVPEAVEPLELDEPEVYRALVTGLGDYVRKNGFTDVVIGLSGGIDSALCACVAHDALGADRVHGVMMPGRYSSPGSVDDARALAGALGIDLLTLPIEPAFTAFTETLSDAFAGLEPDVTEENLQARVRGTLLMALSNKFGWLVLATGNKSESSVGYSTLYGDMVGGFAPLKDVLKTRVYELARWRNTVGEPVIPESSIVKPPSAELRPGQTDQDSLPPYEVLDAVLERYVELDQSADDIASSGFDAETVERIVRMTDAAEYKRRQAAPGVKITPKAFGRDRRMPLTNRYRG